MSINKLFKSLDEQVDIQKKRNLNCFDDKMKKDLLKYNYFNIINAFEDLLLDDLNNKKYGSKSFYDFKRLYSLDRKLSKFLFENILAIENEVKTSIAYYFSESYCSLGESSILNYLDSSNYGGVNTSGADPEGQKMFDKHILFKDNIRISVVCNDIYFDGDIDDDSNPRYQGYKLLDGKFTGAFKGLSNNIYKGVLSVKASDLGNISNGSYINFKLKSNLKGYLKCSSYSDYCKIKYPYISKYTRPPMWVIINTFTIKQIYYLYMGLDEAIKTKIIKSVSDGGFYFNGSLNKESFLNALELLSDVRNKVYQGYNISLIRSPSNIKINPVLINNLNLEPQRGAYYDIRLLDIIKIFDLFNSFDSSNIKKALKEYRFQNIQLKKNDVNKKMMDRIGRF